MLWIYEVAIIICEINKPWKMNQFLFTGETAHWQIKQRTGWCQSSQRCARKENLRHVEVSTVMRHNTSEKHKPLTVKLNSEQLEGMSNFKYLGSIISTDGNSGTNGEEKVQ